MRNEPLIINTGRVLILSDLSRQGPTRRRCFPDISRLENWERFIAGRMKFLPAFVFLIICSFVLEYAEGNIHRAVHTRRRPKQESGFLARFYTKLKKSWLAIPASFLVGCTGIFPLLIIPVQSGKSLKEGSK